WERAVASFLADGLGDVVISGSNAGLLSSELATLLSGRYVEIPVYPLTFREFLSFRNAKRDGGDRTDTAAEAENEFKNYLRYGGLPGIHQLPANDDVLFSYLNAVLNTILYKDVITRHKIRDASIFDKLVRYLFDNVGNITTAKRIADYFKSQRIRTSVDTILNYISYVEASLLIDKAPRYDIKGKRLLEFFDKVFLNDIGLRHGLIGYREEDINGLLENIVFKELQARGYKISIGVIDQLEIDFIAEKQNEKKYIQVCYGLGSEAAIEREFGNLEKIKDNYEKMVISMDRFFPAERNGILHRYLIDFLLE
ncbi:MAG TPA: ATP-binding protein, partial [Syntrophales bacterium]|nr:ATP-binding protein [Syntrophales bacterium]